MRSGSQVRVVSWNLDHWQGSAERRAESWRYLDETLAQELDWDVALLQECAPPPDRRNVVRPVRDGPCGTAVVTRDADLRHLDLEDDSLPGCLVAAEVDLGERGEVTVVSMYGLNEFRKRVGDETSPHRYAITSVHRLLSDLTPLIDLRGRVRSPRPLVLAGDPNVSTQLDPPDRERHGNVLERFASMGLTDAWEVSPDKVPADDMMSGPASGSSTPSQEAPLARSPTGGIRPGHAALLARALSRVYPTIDGSLEHVLGEHGCDPCSYRCRQTATTAGAGSSRISRDSPNTAPAATIWLVLLGAI